MKIEPNPNLFYDPADIPYLSCHYDLIQVNWGVKEKNFPQYFILFFSLLSIFSELSIYFPYFYFIFPGKIENQFISCYLWIHLNGNSSDQSSRSFHLALTPLESCCSWSSEQWSLKHFPTLFNIFSHFWLEILLICSSGKINENSF